MVGKLGFMSVHRLDRRDNRRGEGVALYILDSANYTVRRDLEDDFEVIWIQMQLRKVNYLIGFVYRAPDESLEVFDYLDDVMRHATKNKLEVIIIGDLNCDINTTSRQTDRLMEFTMANDLEQLINEPTRVTSTTSTLIDALITSTLSLFKKAGAINITFSDHYSIYGIMHSLATRPSKHRTITTSFWNDKKVNDFLADLKQAPWSLIYSFTDVDDMCSTCMGIADEIPD